MTKEEKELLLKDLCARVPYHPKGLVVNACTGAKCKEWLTCATFTTFMNVTNNCRLYLRPISSMTEKEKEDFYQNVLDMDIEDIRYENNGKLPLPYNQKDKFIWFEDIYLDNAFAVIDWLNAHHFDFRNLIEKGLAIEVTEENDPYKE